MTDPPGGSSTSQVLASLQHDKIILQRQLTDVRLENQMLRYQLYQMGTLLDLAMSKLGTVGVALETPIDVRALRANVQRQGLVEGTQGGGLDGGSLLAVDKVDGAGSVGRRFQLRAHLREHTKAVQCCAFAPGEDPLLVTGGLDCRLVLQNFFSGVKQWDIVAHDENIVNVAWFESTQNLLSASYDGTARLWDVRRGEAKAIYEHSVDGFILSAIPLDKAFVFACADSRRRTAIVDLRTRKSIAWEHESRVNSLTFDPSVAQLVMGHGNGVISIWDIRKAGLALSSVVNTAGPAASTVSSQTADEVAGGSATTASPGLTNAGFIPANAFLSLPPSLPSAATSLPTASSGNTAVAGSALLRPETETAPAHGGGGYAGTTNPVHCVSQFVNEVSHSAISFLAHFNASDETKRLICVSGDNMVRLYRGVLQVKTGGARPRGLYQLRNVLPNISTRGFRVRSAFWKGKRDKSQESMLFDDGEKDMEQPAPRRLTELDLVFTGGPDNSATVFDVTEEESTVVVDHLTGHRDRVTGATLHHSDNRLIVATTSVDSTVRIWVPTKT